ncbi:F-box protein At3g07870-like [Panicum virgatum]|uniref:F-box protein At3g07870-like n=1 Tax=Panicum virgatum TaxID=38727 RepID=UPI0019D6699B|nr:F-box protein At3g07870-like [Panicum virgatum]
MADEGFRRLPDDVLMQILVLLPTSSRRRFRLACKRWRDMINEFTPERQVGANALAFMSQQRNCSRALVFDKKDGLRRHEWIYPCSHERSKIEMVGTCNGLLCLHETMASVGNGGGSFLSAITVTNLITSEALALPPAPRSWEQEQVRLPGKYSFGYHLTTGRYKVVHIPCGRRQAVSALQVFTVGDDAAWREVPVDTRPGVTYDLQCEPISVDGRTYWLDAFSDRMMALDLEDESVASFAAPPAARLGPIPEDAGWKLANVRGRLAVVVVAAAATARVEVWVRDGEGVLPHWTRRYDIAVKVMAPTMAAPDGFEELVMSEEESDGDLKVFAYVETLEPLPGIQR